VSDTTGRGKDPESALEALERAEQRLDARGRERTEARERLRGRRERRARLRGLFRLPVVALALAVFGAVIFVVTVESAGGDLSGTPSLTATLLVLAELLGPALVAGLLARREGWAAAVGVGVGVFSVELALSFGLAFTLFDLGPR
jgi:hypothetical protein